MKLMVYSNTYGHNLSKSSLLVTNDNSDVEDNTDRGFAQFVNSSCPHASPETEFRIEYTAKIKKTILIDQKIIF